MEKIGIFCSASGNIDKMYFDMAGRIGKWMGETGKTLVYGGASLGLMECVAQAVKTNGGHIIGVVPAKLEENGKVSALPDRIINKKVIFYNEDGFYDTLLKALKEIEEKGFARQPFSTYYDVANTLEELKQIITTI